MIYKIGYLKDKWWWRLTKVLWFFSLIFVVGVSALGWYFDIDTYSPKDIERVTSFYERYENGVIAMDKIKQLSRDQGLNGLVKVSQDIGNTDKLRGSILLLVLASENYELIEFLRELGVYEVCLSSPRDECYIEFDGNKDFYEDFSEPYTNIQIPDDLVNETRAVIDFSRELRENHRKGDISEMIWVWNREAEYPNKIYEDYRGTNEYIKIISFTILTVLAFVMVSFFLFSILLYIITGNLFGKLK